MSVFFFFFTDKGMCITDNEECSCFIVCFLTDDVKGIHGTVSLMDAIQPIPLQEVNEDHWLPGDRRGAVGFDSSLFM